MPDESPHASPVQNCRLGDIQALSIHYLRKWFDGHVSQAETWNDMARAFGADEGAIILKNFEVLTDQVMCFSLHPLMRHPVECKCVSADEYAFAEMIAAAIEGKQHTAEELAKSLVRPDIAPGLTLLARKFGMALKRMLSTENSARNAPMFTKKYLH